jgi:NitT/TauT family transport system substrate-binding protein
MRRIGAVVLAAAMLVVAGCGDDGGESTGPTALKVGVLATSGMAPLYLAIDKGFFRQENLEVTPVVGQGGAELLPSVLKGDFQLGYGNPVSLMLARERGLPVRIVAEGSQGAPDASRSTNALLVRKDSGIRSVRDLAGKTFAVTTLKNSGEVTIKAALEKHGVDTAGIKFIEVPFPEMNAALDRGAADVAWTTEPFITIGERQGLKSVLDPILDLMPNATVASYFTTERYISEHGDVVDRFRRAIGKAARYADQHPDEVRRIIPKFLKIKPDVLAKIKLTNWSDEVNVASLRRQYELSLKYGVLEKPFDIDRLLPEEAN